MPDLPNRIQARDENLDLIVSVLDLTKLQHPFSDAVAKSGMVEAAPGTPATRRAHYRTMLTGMFVRHYLYPGIEVEIPEKEWKPPPAPIKEWRYYMFAPDYAYRIYLVWRHLNYQKGYKVGTWEHFRAYIWRLKQIGLLRNTPEGSIPAQVRTACNRIYLEWNQDYVEVLDISKKRILTTYHYGWINPLYVQMTRHRIEGLQQRLKELARAKQQQDPEYLEVEKKLAAEQEAYEYSIVSSASEWETADKYTQDLDRQSWLKFRKATIDAELEIRIAEDEMLMQLPGKVCGMGPALGAPLEKKTPEKVPTKKQKAGLIPAEQRGKYPREQDVAAQIPGYWTKSIHQFTHNQLGALIGLFNHQLVQVAGASALEVLTEMRGKDIVPIIITEDKGYVVRYMPTSSMRQLPETKVLPPPKLALESQAKYPPERDVKNIPEFWQSMGHLYLDAELKRFLHGQRQMEFVPVDKFADVDHMTEIALRDRIPYFVTRQQATNGLWMYKVWFVPTKVIDTWTIQTMIPPGDRGKYPRESEARAWFIGIFEIVAEDGTVMAWKKMDRQFDPAQLKTMLDSRKYRIVTDREVNDDEALAKILGANKTPIYISEERGYVVRWLKITEKETAEETSPAAKPEAPKQANATELETLQQQLEALEEKKDELQEKMDERDNGPTKTQDKQMAALEDQITDLENEIEELEGEEEEEETTSAPASPPLSPPRPPSEYPDEDKVGAGIPPAWILVSTARGFPRPFSQEELETALDKVPHTVVPITKADQDAFLALAASKGLPVIITSYQPEGAAELMFLLRVLVPPGTAPPQF